MSDQALDRAIEARVEALGFELVELERAGSSTRPILRLRIDREDSTPEHGVTLEDCTRVSRAVEAFLDERADLGERYVLEVSSPGVERPLVKQRDFERFAGKEVTVKTSHPVGELGKRVDGVLRGISAGDRVQIDVNGRTVEIPRDDIKKAHLVFRWDNKEKR
ncbi:MAG: ribosome maturation factor RimP [Gemmatimonadota bacterium]